MTQMERTTRTATGSCGAGRPFARLRTALSLLLTAATVSACGYSFSGSGLPAHVKSVAIPTFGNETVEAELGPQLTTALTDRLVRDGRLKVAPESQAQARVEAVVNSYDNKVYNYTTGQTPQDYIVVVKLSVTLRDLVKNREIWKDEGMSGTAIYAPGGGSGPLTNEADARAEVVQNLARDIVSKTLESW